MADGDGCTLLLCAANGKLQLAANGASLPNIIEERHIAKSASHAVVRSGVQSDGCRGGAAIDEEEVPFAESGHQFRHEGYIRSGQRALMIVHPNRVRNTVEHHPQLLG